MVLPGGDAPESLAPTSTIVSRCDRGVMKDSRRFFVGLITI